MVLFKNTCPGTVILRPFTVRREWGWVLFKGIVLRDSAMTRPFTALERCRRVLPEQSERHLLFDQSNIAQEETQMLFY